MGGGLVNLMAGTEKHSEDTLQIGAVWEIMCSNFTSRVFNLTQPPEGLILHGGSYNLHVPLLSLWCVQAMNFLAVVGGLTFAGDGCPIGQ